MTARPPDDPPTGDARPDDERSPGCKPVRRRLPTRVLVVTTYDLDAYVYGALRAGATGFLLKTTPPDRLVEGIETVAAGEALLAPELTRRLIEEHVRRPAPSAGVPSTLRALTPRELETVAAGEALL